MVYRVLGDKVLVRRDAEDNNEGGLLLPSEVKKAPRVGEVVSVGEEVTRVTPGERVVFHEYAGHFLKVDQNLDESDLIVMREDEILAVEDSLRNSAIYEEIRTESP